jgi:pimeloyl-ACP methyl ester carboxylesterase
VIYLKLEVQEQRLKMAYMDVQPENYNGKNVLLLHGKNFNGAYWETTIRALTEEGYRVIVPDQIGFGKSDKPAHFQYSFHTLAMNTKILLDTLGVGSTTVLGHSMGGMLASRFALMYPEVTEKLVLVNPIGLEDYKLKIPYKPVSWWYKNELEKDYEAIKSYQKENYYDGNWKPAYDEWVNLLAGWTLSEDYPRIAWNAALTYDMILTQPVVYEFEKIESPTLLIIGTRDRTALGKPLVSEEVRATMGLYDELGEQTRRRIPDAELVELEGLGHLPHIEAFDRYIKPLKDFLKK